jgi:light-regulated signal transduction histidine kinase (bacteriophytochrome)
MIHHIFQNLIVNGIKFNTSGSPEVRISCHSGPEGHTFHIRDNGIGIDGRFKDKLFQMFKRLHTDAKFEGTGIGLAACRKIVNYYVVVRYGLKAKVGVGTTIPILLASRYHPTALTRDITPMPPPHGSSSPAFIASCSVLVIAHKPLRPAAVDMLR